MKKLHITLVVLICFVTANAFAQQPSTLPSSTVNLNRSIDFKPSMSVIQFQHLSRNLISTTPTVSFVNINLDEIDFNRLPLLTPQNEFPTVYNTNKEPFFQFGDYTPEFYNKKTNNLAFFEATHNTVLSAGYSNGTFCAPQM